jgi:large conductance mechanosensitive channel
MLQRIQNLLLGATMSMMQEFKAFAMRGNVVDLAIGVIIGAAFGKIVTSLVEDVIMPLVSGAIGKLDFSNLFVVLGSLPEGVPRTLDAVKKAGIPVLAYGNFITILVNFIILAFIIFLVVRQINRMNKPAAEAAPEAPAEDVLLLREIRDSLRNR